MKNEEERNKNTSNSLINNSTSLADSLSEHRIKLLAYGEGERNAAKFLQLLACGLIVAALVTYTWTMPGILVKAAFAFLAFGLFALSKFIREKAPHVTLIYDRLSQELRVDEEKQGIRKTRTFKRSDIKGPIVTTKTDSDSDTFYYLNLELADGEMIPISNGIGVRQGFQYRIDVINDAINYNCANHDRLEEVEDKQKRVPPAVWVAVILVVAMPLLGQPLAQVIEHRQTTIVSGPPSPETAALLTQQLTPVSSVGEKILWAGQPEPGRETATKWWFSIFGIIWTLFSVCWTWAAFGFGQGRVASWGMGLFGIPFVLVGFGMLSIPYVSYMQDLNTTYVITTKHAYQIVQGRPSILTAFNWRAFGPITVENYKKDHCDIMFARRYSDDRKPSIGFYGIEDGRQVESTLQSYLVARESKPLDPNEQFETRPPSSD